MKIHPGLVPILKRMSADELTIAEMIRDGELSSPQHYHNMVLFLIRITGTGVSYRPALNEYVYRKPEHYLTDRFLQRCNGLPVIWQHPKKSLLTSKEFGDRIVGTVFLPFIREDEVWAVVKIFDAEAIQILNTEQMSTSPAVLLEPGSAVKETTKGERLLIEEKPKLLDHIAICEQGVWDKGGLVDPGIESEMADAYADSISPVIVQSNLLTEAQRFSIAVEAFVRRMERHCACSHF